MRVLNDTGDFYRFFDATPHAEFLYSCVKQTIDVNVTGAAATLCAVLPGMVERKRGHLVGVASLF